MNSIATDFVAAMTVFPSILHLAVRGAAFLGLAAVAVLLMGRASAAARNFVWLTGMVGMLMAPVLSIVLPGWRVLPAWPARQHSMALAGSTATSPFPGDLSIPNAAMNPTTVSGGADARSARPVSISSKSSGFAARSVSVAVPDRFNPWIAGTWLAVGVILVLRLLACLLLLKRSTRTAVEVSEGPMVEAVGRACALLAVRRPVRLFLHEGRIVPLVWGFFRPRLLLPVEARDWNEPRLRSVLLHELAHVQRHDSWAMLLTQIAGAIYWFNPLAWLAAWRLQIEREQACDDLVLNAGVKASDYAEHLLHVATTLEARSSNGALAMTRASRLEGRLLAVLNRQANRSGVTRLLALGACAAGLVVLIPISTLSASNAQSNAAVPSDLTTDVENSPAAQELAEATLRHAESEFERLTKLHAAKLISESEFLKAERAVELRRAEWKLADRSDRFPPLAAAAEERITQVFKLKHAKAENAARLLQNFTSTQVKIDQFTPGQAKIAVDQQSNSIIVTAPKKELATLAATIQLIDSLVARTAEDAPPNRGQTNPPLETPAKPEQFFKNPWKPQNQNQIKPSPPIDSRSRSAAVNSATGARTKELNRLLDEEIKLLEEQVSILQAAHEAGRATPNDVLPAQAELTALRRTKAAQAGQPAEVEKLYDEQIQLLEELAQAYRGMPTLDWRERTTLLNIRREILNLKRQKLLVP